MRKPIYFAPLCLGLAVPAVWADTPHYHIGQQPLYAALNALAEQGDLQFVYTADMVKGLNSPGVSGRIGTEEALKRVLAGSNLDYRFSNQRTITLSRKPQTVALNDTAPAAESVTLPPVTVTDQRASVVDDPHNRDYQRSNARTATKTDTPIMQTPVSIQVIPRAVMDDQQAISVADAVKNVSGVQPGGYTFYDNFILRGFDANFSTYRNGLRHQSTTSLETANLDRIEVLKGPAAVLFGRSEPGGLINLATKRPLEEAYYSVQQQFGSYDLYRTTIDATGPILGDRSLLYRINIAYKDNNSFQDKVTQESVFVAPSFTWRPNERFETNLDIEYQHNEFVDISDIGIPAIGKRPAQVPISRFLGDPAAKNLQDRVLVGLDWTYHFNSDWKVTNRFQYNDVTYNQNTFWAAGLNNDQILDRGLWKADMIRRTFATNVDLIGHFTTAMLEHKVLTGFDFYRFDGEYSAFGGITPLVPAIDIFNPRYGVNLSSLTARDYNQYGTFPEQWYGIYFQDHITLWDKLHILGGGRHDWAEIGSGFSPTSLDTVSTNYTRAEYFSPRVGIVYQPWPWLSLYGNYVESLGSNNNGTPFPGTTLSPQTAQQWEVGIKTDWLDGRINSTLAFFDLTKQNVVARIPGEIYDRTVGEANSQGVEWDISGQVTESLKLIGSYAYTDAKITKDFTGTEGNQLVSAPRNSGSLWLNYQFLDEFLPGLSLGTGIYARSQRMADVENTAQLPGYVRWDASVGYSFKHFGPKITTQLNVYNILDKAYYDHANTRLTTQPGMPLTFLGSVRVEF